MSAGAESCEALTEFLGQQIQFALEHFLYDNAIFLAERLMAEFSTEESLALLANAHFRKGDIQKAYSLLKEAKSSRNRFLFARCCWDLNRLEEGEAILAAERTRPDRTVDLSAISFWLGQFHRFVWFTDRSKISTMSM